MKLKGTTTKLEQASIELQNARAEIAALTLQLDAVQINAARTETETGSLHVHLGEVETENKVGARRHLGEYRLNRSCRNYRDMLASFSESAMICAYSFRSSRSKLKGMASISSKPL